MNSVISPNVSFQTGQRKYLFMDVTFEEVRIATFDLAPDKTPGPDGYLPFFFQKYWFLVGRSVFRIVKALFCSDEILKETNHNFTTFISKFDNSYNPKLLSTISLCSYNLLDYF